MITNVTLIREDALTGITSHSLNDDPKFYLKVMYDPKENLVLRNQSQLNILHMEQPFETINSRSHDRNCRHSQLKIR